MKGKSGREMRKLMLAVSLSVLILVLSIIAYFMVDVILTSNRNIERNQELVVEQSVLTLSQIGEKFANLTTSAEVLGLVNQDIITDIASGNMDALYDFVGKFVTSLYPLDFVGVIADGKLVSYGTSGGFEIDPAEVSLEPPEEDYEVITELGGKEGYFVSQFYSSDLKIPGMEDFYVNLIVDRTEEMADVRSYFEAQRNDLLLRLSIAAVVAVILSLLLTTLGLGYFTRKYVVKPIEDLNRMAEEIAGGTFEGEVPVDPDSAYSTLQGLLRSGQMVLRRMDEDLKE